MKTYGRYRWRLLIRGNMPRALVRFFPKGKKVCGNHVFYKDSEELDLCYFCRVGERRPSQYPPSANL